MNVQAGCAEQVIPVPLFAELGGYGPFLGRRCLEVRDPLCCRVLTVNDGTRRNAVVVTDTIASDELQCRLLRMELATAFGLFPESIMFVATHTHSAPGVASCDIGYGEASPEFAAEWRRTIKQTFRAALSNEEPIRAEAGCAPVRKPLGSRRTTGDDRRIDPAIRWVRLLRADGSCKVLLHNHAMHGVTIGAQRFVSADWMGAANAEIKRRKLAEIPFFLYGTAGDINVIWTDEKGEAVPIEQLGPQTRKAAERNLEWISQSYVDDLEASLGAGEAIAFAPVGANLAATEFPTEPVDGNAYRDIATRLLRKLPNPHEKLLRYIHDRMIEMATLADAGHEFRVIRDLQALRMGDLAVYAVPGEPFLAVGEALRAGSPARFPLAVSVANGDAGYYPTRAMFEQYPTIFDCDDFGAFGFYEVWFGPGLHRPKFKPEIVDFLVARLLALTP